MSEDINVTGDSTNVEALDELELGYKQMSEDDEREAEALEWAEATSGDVADEPDYSRRLLQN